MKKFIYIIFFFILPTPYSLLPTIYAQQWSVPADKKEVTAPFIFDADKVKQGEQIYNKYCLSCHGTPGKGNNIKMKPIPPDPATKEYQANTDGEIFYKMTEGKGPMPSFRNIIEEKDRWLIISYVRSFNKDYVQPEIKFTEEANHNANIKLKVVLNEKRKAIDVFISQKPLIDAHSLLPTPYSLQGCQVSLFARRYFGDMKISETKLSDKDGKVSIIYPEDLPGDTAGNIKLKVKVNNESADISLSKDTILKIGVITKQANLLDKRAWWNVRAMAPLWLIITYSLSVLTVLGIVFYIISLLYKMWKAGKVIKLNNDES